LKKRYETERKQYCNFISKSFRTVPNRIVFLNRSGLLNIVKIIV